MLKVLPGIKALIFDFDGTLVDTMPLHLKAWQEVASKNDFVFPSDFFYEKAGVPTRKLIPELMKRCGVSMDVETLVKEKEQTFIKRIDQVCTIEPVLRLVRENYGILPMSLGTGGRRYITEMVLKKLELDTYFDYIISSDDVSCHKPAPDTFLACAELMNVAPGECQVFEDGDAGLEAAIIAGMVAVDVRSYI